MPKEDMIPIWKFNKYKKESDSFLKNALRTEDTNWDSKKYMPTELMIPIEIFKKHMRRELMIPIETFKTVCIENWDPQ